MSQPRPADEILAFYARGREDARLVQNGWGQLEQARTQELLERYLPPAPAVVLDVGGGSGRYAVWLAERGYAVHLIDPVPLHLEQAAQRSATALRPLASIQAGDARALEVPDAVADAVLLLGPLYHLPRRDDRIAALRETQRAVRPGGVVLAAVITRFASALDGLAKHLFDDPAYAQIVQCDLTEGQHRDGPPGSVPGRGAYFTTAYLHRPEELADEVAASGLVHEATLAIEGPAWLLQDLDEQWRDPVRRGAILRVTRSLEAEPSLLGASSHLLVVCRKRAAFTTHGQADRPMGHATT